MWDTIIFYMEVRGWPKAFDMGHRKHLLQLSLRFPLKGPRQDFLYLYRCWNPDPWPQTLCGWSWPFLYLFSSDCCLSYWQLLRLSYYVLVITSLPPSLLPSFFLSVQPYFKNNINCFYLSVARGENSINLTDHIARSLKTLIICTQCDHLLKKRAEKLLEVSTFGKVARYKIYISNWLFGENGRLSTVI